MQSSSSGSSSPQVGPRYQRYLSPLSHWITVVQLNACLWSGTILCRCFVVFTVRAKASLQFSYVQVLEQGAEQSQLWHVNMCGASTLHENPAVS